MSEPTAPTGRVPTPEPDPDPLVLEELLRAFATDEPPDEVTAEVDAAVDALLADDEHDADPDADLDETVPAGPGDSDDRGPDHRGPDGHGSDPSPDPSAVSTGDAGSQRPAPTIVQITDDELPDAVYLSGDPVARITADLADLTPSGSSPGTDGAGSDSGSSVRVRTAGGERPADASGDRAVVFIDDDDRGNTVAATESRRPGIEPKFRDRRIAVRRAASRRRLRWVALAVLVVVLLLGALAVLGSPLFAIDAGQVRVTGVVYTDEDALQLVIDDLVGTPVLTADTRAAEEAIEDIAWVDTARVRRRFPDGVTIDIRERTPLATYQGDDGLFRVIDRDGRVLDVLQGQPIAYMLVTGPDPANLAESEFAPVGYAAAAELVQALTPNVRGRVASVEVTADGSSLHLLLDDGTEVRFGAANDLLTKLVRLETVLPRAAERGATVIDVSTAEVTIR